MAHYAKVELGIVTQVIVAELSFFETYVDETPGEWIQTSYNTIGGQHVNGGTPLRKNYASVGGIYDSTRDAFISPKPYPSWVLNEDSCLWESPVAYPDNGERYEWNEENQTWDEI
jgi:hypothetical protein